MENTLRRFLVGGRAVTDVDFANLAYTAVTLINRGGGDPTVTQKMRDFETKQ